MDDKNLNFEILVNREYCWVNRAALFCCRKLSFSGNFFPPRNKNFPTSQNGKIFPEMTILWHSRFRKKIPDSVNFEHTYREKNSQKWQVLAFPIREKVSPVYLIQGLIIMWWLENSPSLSFVIFDLPISKSNLRH